MDDSKIRGYAELMRELDLTGIEVTEDGATLRLERGKTVAPADIAAATVKQQAVPNESSAAGGEFCSPMVGVFYCSATENGKPFVKLGDTIHKGDVLCVIEAMKLMNEIISDRDGVITEVCVSDGQTVDFGHVLFRIRGE